MKRKQIRHWLFTRIACCPSLSIPSWCSLFPGGTLRSSSCEARSMYSSFLRARGTISAGSFLDDPVMYNSCVCLSAKVLIMFQCIASRDTCQSNPSTIVLFTIINAGNCRGASGRCVIDSHQEPSGSLSLCSVAVETAPRFAGVTSWVTSGVLGAAGNATPLGLGPLGPAHRPHGPSSMAGVTYTVRIEHRLVDQTTWCRDQSSRDKGTPAGGNQRLNLPVLG